MDCRDTNRTASKKAGILATRDASVNFGTMLAVGKSRFIPDVWAFLKDPPTLPPGARFDGLESDQIGPLSGFSFNPFFPEQAPRDFNSEGRSGTIPAAMARFPLLKLIRRLAFAFLLATATPVALLRWLPPPTSAFMLEARLWAYLAGEEGFRLRYRWVDWAAISPHAKLAVMAAEDQLFPEHRGFDLRAIEKAFRHNRNAKRPHGASTLSQQVAKNLFLHPSRSFLRKGLEAYFTALIELLWPKRRILEVYLNIVQFGTGLYGVAEASRFYFGKPPAALTGPEAALLAAVLPNPLELRVDRPSNYVQKRRRWILKQMNQLGGTAFLGRL
jgi:monofunctional biosynthetic peptidoglycan transglycosylase